jgi:DNA-binding MarR family transcriptional regulator
LTNEFVCAILSFVQQTTSVRNVSAKRLAGELLSLFHNVMKGGNEQLYALFEELDLTITQLKTLHALDACVSEVSVKELAERLNMSLPGASRTVELLLRRGWLERREDEQDRRMKRVRITDAGRDVVRRIDGARLQGLEAFAATLAPEQRTRLSDALAGLPHTC